MTTHQVDPSKTSNARTRNVIAATSAPFSNSTRILLTSSRQSNPATYQQKLALRLHEIQLEKQALRTAHNATTKICSLPDEVLSRIFLDLQELASIERRGAKKKNWVSKTNICRRWREVAIGCASLWTSPSFAYNMQEWAAIMLDRSKQAPLTLKLDEYALLSDNPPDPTSSKGSLLSGIAGRLRVVKIQSTYRSKMLSELLSHCQWSTAPILESLTVDNHSGRFDSTGSIIPDNFLLGGSPSLKKLEVLFCFVEWSKLPIHNVPLMTHLSLAGLNKDTQDPNRPLAKALADALRAMPLLESLALVEYLPVNRENPAYHTRTTLPALTSLKLVDSGKRIKHFLDTIALPDSASIDIHDRTEVAHSDDIKAQFLSVIACLETGPRANINPSILDGVRRLDVSFSWRNLYDHWVYKMWPVIDDDTSKPETFKFTYQDPSDRLVAADKLQLLQVFNLDPLETLFVDGCNAARTDGWRRVFASLPNLKEITLGNGTHFGRFVRAMRLGQLGTDTGVPGESGGPQAFPSLSTLKFSKIDLNMKRTLQKRKAINPFVKFCDVMKKRSKSSAPVLELTIEECENISKADRQALKAAGRRKLRVKWDGREKIASDTAQLRNYPEFLVESSDDDAEASSRGGSGGSEEDEDEEDEEDEEDDDAKVSEEDDDEDNEEDDDEDNEEDDDEDTDEDEDEADDDDDSSDEDDH